MPELIPGYNFEQKVSRVADNDTAINAEITAQGEDVDGGWTVSDLIVSGTDMVILFQRQIPIVET
jgi:ABC-type transporter MlaC component